MKIYLHATAALCAVVLACGCATITRGSTQDFEVQSTPTAAAVKTSNGFDCPATPCKFKVSRKDAFDVTVSKAGFVDQAVRVTSSATSNGTMMLLGNILLGGIIGLVVDASTGAGNDLSPNPLLVTLLAQPPKAQATPPAAAPVVPAPAAAAPVAAAAAAPVIATTPQ